MKPGDIVKLKTGGPFMVVGRVTAGNNLVIVFWWPLDEKGSWSASPQRGEVYAECLKLVEEK